MGKEQTSKQTPSLSVFSLNTFSLVVSRLLRRLLSNPNSGKKKKTKQKTAAAVIGTLSQMLRSL